MNMFARLVVVAFTTAGSVLPAHADEAVVARWYLALQTVDRATLSELLAENAFIRLDDLGITRDKSAFLSSMDQWQQTVLGAEIRHKVEGVEGAVTTVLACYDFPENDILMRENFVIADGKISENMQATIADNCSGF